MVHHHWRSLRLPLLALVFSVATLLVCVAVASAQHTDQQTGSPLLGDAVRSLPTVAQTVAGVTIEGPTEGLVNETYTFTATVVPTDTATPITYTWQADGQTLNRVFSLTTTTSAVDYQWPTAETYHITVTAENAAGGPLTATHTITITAPMTQPVAVAPASLSIAGPENGITDETYIFTATVAPTDTTTPVSYTWDATDQTMITVVITDGLTNPISFTWDMTGTKFITATAFNAASRAPVSATHTIVITGGMMGTPLTGVAIAGPDAGTVGQNLDFTATITPSDATEPITYTWLPEPARLRDNGARATYNFTISGTQMISVVAHNPVSGPVTATRMVDISAIVLEGVELNGPAVGAPGTAVRFTARPQPNNPTGPITYTWSPAPDEGADHSGTQANFTFAMTGTQTITVAALDPYGGPFTATAEIEIVAGFIGLEAVTIVGPDVVEAGADVGFAAVITPSSATPPVMYTWAPTPTMGQGTANVTYTVPADQLGPWTLAVTATNSRDDESSQVTMTKTVMITEARVGESRVITPGTDPEPFVPVEGVALDFETPEMTATVRYVPTITGTLPVSSEAIISFTLSIEPADTAVPTYTGTLNYTTVPTSGQEVALLRWDGSMWVDVTPTAAATGSLSYTTNALGQFALVTRPTTTAQSGIYLPILLR